MPRHAQRENGTAPATSAAVSVGAMQAIVTWCEALNGTVPLQTALAELVAGLGAEAGMIVRTQLSDLRPTRIATCDLAGQRHAVRPLQRSFADSFFGPMMLRARPATIWQASVHADDATGDPALAEWQGSRRLNEFVTIVLTAGPQTRDHIELHFRDLMSTPTETTLAAMLPHMVRIWASRRVGLVTRSIINHRAEPVQARGSGQRGVGMGGAIAVDLLGPDNPAQLSRAEFRVCFLLARGLMVQAVARELALSEPTIRTHLRNIYAKADCASLAELVFRLMDGRQSQAAQDRPASRSA